MTPADWALLSPGIVSLALHGPLWARSRRHARQLGRLESAGGIGQGYTVLARRAPPGPDASYPVAYRFVRPEDGQRLNTISESLARQMMDDPDWRQL